MPSTTTVAQFLAERKKAIASLIVSGIVWLLLHVLHVAQIDATYQVIITGAASTIATYLVTNAPKWYEKVVQPPPIS
jgi:membrane protease YdiL (CAAX protease family)